MKPIRVLHVSQPTEAGVANVLLSYLARSAPGETHLVACPKDSVLSNDVIRRGHEYVAWEATRAPDHGLMAEVRSLRAVIRRVEPDVVHLHSSKAGLAGRLAVRGTLPTVFQPHAWSFSAVRGFPHRLSLQWERTAQRWTHATICVSNDERSRGRACGVLGPDDSVHSGIVIPNAVDPALWARDDRTAAREVLGVPVDAPLVVCVGRLCRQKGQDLLLSAWPRVVAGMRRSGALEGACGDPQLALIGDGPDRQTLARSSPSGVRLIGSADPHSWYAAGDVAVVPSRWEAMAMVPLEAQASGLPVVAADVDGMRERLHPEQLIVPPEQPDALARALIQMLSDRPAAARIGASARRLAEEQWASLGHDTSLNDIYTTVMAVGSTGPMASSVEPKPLASTPVQQDRPLDP